MQLFCPNCRFTIYRENIGRKTRVAKCLHCHSVFRFSEQSLRRGSESGGQPGVMPGIRFRRSERELHMVLRWFSPLRLLLLALPLGIEGSLIVLDPWIAQYVPFSWCLASFSVLICMGAFYGMLATLFNRSHIRVTRDSLRITHGPIPWASPLKLHERDIRQLYVPPVFTKHRRGSKSYAYSLWALTHRGGRVQLLSSLRDLRLARFIEHQIEDFLHIVDFPVPGEAPR